MAMVMCWLISFASRHFCHSLTKRVVTVLAYISPVKIWSLLSTFLMIIILILCVLLKENRLRFRCPFERHPQQQQTGKKYEENNSKQKQNNTKPKQTTHKENHFFFFLNEWLTRRNYTRALKMLNLRVSNLTRPTCIPFLVPWNRRGNMSDTRNMVLLSVAVISRTSGFLMVYIWTLCLTRPFWPAFKNRDKTDKTTLGKK